MRRHGIAHSISQATPVLGASLEKYTDHGKKHGLSINITRSKTPGALQTFVFESLLSPQTFVVCREGNANLCAPTEVRTAMTSLITYCIARPIWRSSSLGIFVIAFPWLNHNLTLGITLDPQAIIDLTCHAPACRLF